MTFKGEKLVKCPVCSRKYISYALKKHITQMAKRELEHFAATAKDNETARAIRLKSKHFQFIQKRKKTEIGMWDYNI